MTKILLVEDDEVLSQMYEMKFNKEGYDILVAHDGDEGLKKAKEHKPDVLLLDLILPQKDGYQVLKELKKNKDTKDIRVFILSNLGQEEEREKGKKMGAEDYFVKGKFTPGQLMKELKKRIEKKTKA